MEGYLLIFEHGPLDLSPLGSGHPPFLLFTIGKKLLDKNYVEFEFRIDHIHVIFSFYEQ